MYTSVHVSGLPPAINTASTTPPRFGRYVFAIAALTSVCITQVACTGGSPYAELPLPSTVNLTTLNAEQLGLLRATIEIEGDDVLQRPLGFTPDYTALRGSFVLPSEDAARTARVAIRVYGRLNDEAEEVVLTRAFGSLEVAPNQATRVNIASADFETCGADTLENVGDDGVVACADSLDRNQNGLSNLTDLTLGIDPAPGPIHIDASPETLQFSSGISLGSFARQVVVLENSSGDTLDVEAVLVGAPGVTLNRFDNSDLQGSVGDGSALRQIRDFTVPPFGESFLAIAFAPVNQYLATGAVFIRATNQRTGVVHSTRAKVIANTDGALQPPIALVVAIPDTVPGGFDGHIQAFSSSNLASGLAVSQAAPSTSTGFDVEGLLSTGKTISAPFINRAGEPENVELQADAVFAIDVPPGFRFSTSLDEVGSNIDIAFVRLDDNGVVDANSDYNFRSANLETQPEAIEFLNPTRTIMHGLLVMSRNDVAVERGFSADILDDDDGQAEQGLSSSDPAQFALTALLSNAPQFATDPSNPSGGPITPSNVGVLAGGNRVKIWGRGFAAGARVTFADNVALDCVYGEVDLGDDVEPLTTYECTVPPGSLELGKNPATVVVANPSSDEGGDGQAATLPDGYRYLPPAPILTKVTPAVGAVPGGTQVTLTGSFFSIGTGKPIVRFGDVAATSVSFLSSTQLVALAPAQSEAGIVEVVVVNCLESQASATNPGENECVSESEPSNELLFTYVAPDGPAPTLDALTSESPNTGSIDGGENVVLTGTNFDEGATVFFGDNPADVEFISETELRTTTPVATQAGPVDVRVVNSDAQEAALVDAFAYFIPPPRIVTGVTPSTSTTLGGVFVVVEGDDFRPGARVFFTLENTVYESLTVSFVNGTTLLATTPPVTTESDEYTVSVQNPDGQTDTWEGTFAFLAPVGPAPSISGVSPPVLFLDGSQKQIKMWGQNFIEPTVTVGSQLFTDVSPTPCDTEVESQCNEGDVVFTIVVSDPSGAGVQTVRITNSDGQFDDTTIAYELLLGAPPSIFSISPNPVAVGSGATVTVNGANFDRVSVDGADAILRLGGNIVSATVTSTTFTFALPAGLGTGNHVVQVENPSDNQKASSVLNVIAATQSPPVITLVSPSVVVSGTTPEIVVSGQQFHNSASVTVNGASPTLIDGDFTDGTFSFTAPDFGGTPAVVLIRLQNPDGQSDTAVLNLIAPQAEPVPNVTDVSPRQVELVSTSSTITVYGQHLTADAVVTFYQAAPTGVSIATQNAGADDGTHEFQLNVDEQQGAAIGTSVFVITTSAGSAYFTVDIVDERSPPIIGGVSPNVFASASFVQFTIFGSNFDAPADVAVLAGNASGLSCTSKVGSGSTAIDCAVNVGAPGQVTLRVQNDDGKIAVVGFTVVDDQPAPVVTSMNPATIVAGASGPLTLHGGNFVIGPPSTSVTSFDASVVQTGETATSLNLFVDDSANTAPGPRLLTVTNPDGKSVQVVVNAVVQGTQGDVPPSISGITPAIVPLGTQVPITIFGANFDIINGVSLSTSVSGASFGDPNPTPVSTNRIDAVLDLSGVAGPLTIPITVTNTQSGLSAIAAVVAQLPEQVPPFVSDVNPNSVPLVLFNPITVSGGGFSHAPNPPPTLIETDNFASVTYIGNTANSIDFTLDVTGGGPRTILVAIQNPDGKTAYAAINVDETLKHTVTMVAPSVLEVPDTSGGPVSRGITIYGTRLDTVTSVVLNPPVFGASVVPPLFQANDELSFNVEFNAPISAPVLVFDVVDGLGHTVKAVLTLVPAAQPSIALVDLAVPSTLKAHVPSQQFNIVGSDLHLLSDIQLFDGSTEYDATLVGGGSSSRLVLVDVPLPSVLTSYEVRIPDGVGGWLSTGVFLQAVEPEIYAIDVLNFNPSTNQSLVRILGDHLDTGNDEVRFVFGGLVVNAFVIGLPSDNIIQVLTQAPLDPTAPGVTVELEMQPSFFISPFIQPNQMVAPVLGGQPISGPVTISTDINGPLFTVLVPNYGAWLGAGPTNGEVKLINSTTGFVAYAGPDWTAASFDEIDVDLSGFVGTEPATYDLVLSHALLDLVRIPAVLHVTSSRIDVIGATTVSLGESVVVDVSYGPGDAIYFQIQGSPFAFQQTASFSTVGQEILAFDTSDLGLPPFPEQTVAVCVAQEGQSGALDCFSQQLDTFVVVEDICAFPFLARPGEIISGGTPFTPNYPNVCEPGGNGLFATVVEISIPFGYGPGKLNFLPAAGASSPAVVVYDPSFTTDMCDPPAFGLVCGLAGTLDPGQSADVGGGQTVRVAVVSTFPGEPFAFLVTHSNPDSGDPLCAIDNDSDFFSECQGDCNDFDGNISPDDIQTCGSFRDDDCDGFVDNAVSFGVVSGPPGMCSLGGSGFGCSPPTVGLPPMVEVCDGEDNDCDPFTDESSCSGFEYQFAFEEDFPIPHSSNHEFFGAGPAPQAVPLLRNGQPHVIGRLEQGGFDVDKYFFYAERGETITTKLVEPFYGCSPTQQGVLRVFAEPVPGQIVQVLEIRDNALLGMFGPVVTCPGIADFELPFSGKYYVEVSTEGTLRDYVLELHVVPAGGPTPNYCGDGVPSLYEACDDGDWFEDPPSICDGSCGVSGSF